MLTAIVAAISVAFPSAGQRLPPLARCYMIGATDGAETSVVVRTSSAVRSVPVHRSGAWTALVGVSPGTNVVWVGGTRHSFVVADGAIPSVPLPRVAKGPNADVPRSGAGSAAYPKLPYAADEAKPHPAGRKAGDVTIVIDAGHGGTDLGAVSPHGLPEKDANLRLAKRVSDLLAKRGFSVVMTRTNDVAVALYDRPKVAHAAGADAFVSIHHNAPGHSTDPANCRHQAVYAWNAIGERLAKAVSSRMAASSPHIPDRGVMHANFAVTRNSEIPSCLVEVDFITHPDGEVSVWDASRREVSAAAIADGIAAWAAGAD